MNKLIPAILILLFSGVVLAAPPSLVTGEFPSGLHIQVPIKETYKVNYPYTFEIHVFNSSNGVPVISNIGCYFHLYNRTGEHVFEGYDNTSSDGLDYSFTLTGTYFSTPGQYYYNAQCNNSIIGGYAGEYIYVTAQGVPYNTTHGIIYASLILLLSGVFILQLFFIFSIDADNKVSDGRVIQINYMKYLRIFLVAMCYVTFIAINYFAWNIAYGILEFEEMAKFFRVLFTITYSVMYPIFIVIIVWSVAQFVKDRKVEEFVKRNLSFK